MQPGYVVVVELELGGNPVVPYQKWENHARNGSSTVK